MLVLIISLRIKKKKKKKKKQKQKKETPTLSRNITKFFFKNTYNYRATNHEKRAPSSHELP